MKKIPLVKCPYCFIPFKYNNAVFRCASGMRSVDEYLRSYHIDKGNSAYAKYDYGYVDPADLKTNQIETENNYITGVEDPNPATSLPLQQRLCPYCHNNLLINFGKEKTRYIAVIGVPNSGKTTYLAALNDRMRNLPNTTWYSLNKDKSSPLDNVTDLYCNERLSYGISTTYSTPDKSKIDKAKIATKSIMGPYFYELKYLNGQTESNDKCHLVFFDVPGEFYTSADKISKSLSQFLINADGIIFIVNAAEEYEHRELIKKLFDKEAPELDEQNTMQGLSDGILPQMVRVDDILQAFSQTNIINKKKTAIIFNKLDLIQDEIKIGEFTKETKGPVDMSVIDSLSDTIKSHLLGENATNLTKEQESLQKYMRSINDSFGEKNTRVFATRLIINDHFNSVGAETPFLWLLSEIGVYPKAKK
ncbi:MAG: 50S ribosome-binding GTPase [Clostridia bacterium]|nr:50S ribosome-binding GTPase [Clostridia bacterium]